MSTFMAGLANKQFAFWGPELSGPPHVKSATAGLIPPSPAPAGLNCWAAHLAALFYGETQGLAPGVSLFKFGNVWVY